MIRQTHTTHYYAKKSPSFKLCPFGPVINKNIHPFLTISHLRAACSLWKDMIEPFHIYSFLEPDEVLTSPVSAEALEVEAGSLNIGKAFLDAIVFVISHLDLKGSPFSLDGALWFPQFWSHGRVGGERWGWYFSLNFLGNLRSGLKPEGFFLYHTTPRIPFPADVASAPLAISA